MVALVGPQPVTGDYRTMTDPQRKLLLRLAVAPRAEAVIDRRVLGALRRRGLVERTTVPNPYLAWSLPAWRLSILGAQIAESLV